MAEKNVIGDMPHSLEAEQALLGCLLLDPQIQVEVASFLREDDFYSESHKNIYNSMMKIIRENKPVDLVTLSDFLDKNGGLDQVGGMEYLAELTNVIPSSANYQHYQEIVRRDSTLRKLINGSAEIIADCKKSTDMRLSLNFAEKTVFDIADKQDSRSMETIGNVLPEVVSKLDQLSKDKSKYRGLSTGYKGFDAITKGLQKSDLIVLAARPGMGKTSFAMNIVEKVALSGHTCAVFSLEMGREQLAQRMLCSAANVNMENALGGNLSKQEWLSINRARELLSGAKIFIDDTAAVTPQELMSKCRRLKRKHGLDLVMVDYIQLMSSDGGRKDDNRQEQIRDISRNLKIMAKELNVPVIALSQLSRAVETRKGRPQLSDLRESGAIEQDADIVMFIHRPDKYATEKEISAGEVKKNIAEIVIEKHRNGPQGVVELYFKGECTRFLNYNKETDEVINDDTVVVGKAPEKAKIVEIEKTDKPIASETQQTEEKPTSSEPTEYNSASDDPIFG